MNPPLKSHPSLFGQTPTQNTKSFKLPFAPTPLFMRKVLVSPPFFTKSCFMKPIVRYEIMVFHQDLKQLDLQTKRF